MSLYTRARKHIDMNRVKELREEKIERKKIADEIKAQITEDLRNINSPEFSNWRYDIDEGMTTSDIFSTTFPAQGDVDLGAAIETFSLSGPDDGNPNSFNKLEPNTLGNYKQYDTIIVNITSSTSEWRITPLTTLDDLGSGGVGNFRIVIPRSYPGLFFAAFGSGSITVTSTYQRRAPVNAFVSLDSPEATSFIRTDPTMQGLSAEDRKKKLIDMLDAGNEYLLKQLGIVGSSARPSDTTMPVSWDQASAQQGPMPTGPSGYKKPGSYDPNKFFKLAPGSLPSPNIPYTGPGRSNVPGTKDYGNIAQQSDDVERQIDAMLLKGFERGDYTGPNVQKQINNLKRNFKNKTPGGRYLPLAGGRSTMNVAHYEPQGEVLSEKKKLKSPKDITSKIPGYYDGKPAPLGFPMQEPPKMVNGKHPDLVDGKKIANRFNRLDPQSAKAMPPTGNPHIDKKVRVAAKKPK